MSNFLFIITFIVIFIVCLLSMINGYVIPTRIILTTTLRRRNKTRNILSTTMTKLATTTTLATASKEASTSTTTKTSTLTKPKRTFYKRPLPDICIGLSSKEGKKIFASALATNGLKSFFPLIEQFHTQTEPAYCGISTLVLVLNSLSVDPKIPWKGPWRWYEESMLNCCLDLEEVKQTGITLKDFQCLAYCQGLSVDLHYCNPDIITINDFRLAVSKACIENENEHEHENVHEHEKEENDINININNNNDEPERKKQKTIQTQTSSSSSSSSLDILVVSYSRKVLGQTGSGHFSPIGAYDVKSDSVLILDTARFKYGAHWVPLPLLYDAMIPIDKDTGKNRGYALLSFPPSPLSLDDDNNTTNNNTGRALSCGGCGTTMMTISEAVTSNTTINSNTCGCSAQPLSLLLRSKMSQNPIRRQYKEFLLRHKQSNNEKKLSWNDVLSYWTKDGSDWQYIWKILEPLRPPPPPSSSSTVSLSSSSSSSSQPLDSSSGSDDTKLQQKETTITMQRNLFTLLKELIPKDSYPLESLCSNSFHNDSTCMKPQYAIYIVYLASLDNAERKQIVMDTTTKSSSHHISKMTREHLLCEAELVAKAIQTSDQTTIF